MLIIQKLLVIRIIPLKANTRLKKSLLNLLSKSDSLTKLKNRKETFIWLEVHKIKTMSVHSFTCT